MQQNTKYLCLSFCKRGAESERARTHTHKNMNDLKFLEIIHYMPPRRYGQTFFIALQCLTAVAISCFLVVAVLVQVTEWSAVHRLKLVITVFSAIVGSLVFLQLLVAFRYILRKSPAMSHRHNAPIYISVGFTFTLTVAIATYGFAWLIHYEKIGDPYRSVAVDFSAPDVAEFRTYYAFWTFALVMMVFMLDVLCRSILSHRHAEAAHLTTESDALPQIVSVLVNGKHHSVPHRDQELKHLVKRAVREDSVL